MKVKLIGSLAVIACMLVWAAPVYADTFFEDYLDQEDTVFSYRLARTVYNVLYTTYVYEVVSQSWHADAVQPGIWKHWLVIVEPRLLGLYTKEMPFFSLVSTDTALLRIIPGDAEHEDLPSGAPGDAVRLALENRCLVAELHGVPIGPVAFDDEQEDPDWWDVLNPFKDEEDDLKVRKEDSLQARSFDLALETGDYTWVLMAPMVKSVVRCMDVIQELALGRSVRQFILAGHSKRAMTAWLAAAFDSRVAGVASFGYDMLNLPAQQELQESSWDERSPELKVYDEFDLYERFKTPEGHALLQAVDPYSYLDMITIPVLILTGAQDNYSNVDSIHLYLDDLTNDVRLFYDANAGHDVLSPSRAQNTFTAFFRRFLQNSSLPEIAWDGLQGGSFIVTPQSKKPEKAVLWTAVNPEARDFRESAAIEWTYEELASETGGSYSGSVALPGAGSYSAYFIEVVFDDGEGTADYSLATPITVLGD